MTLVDIDERAAGFQPVKVRFRGEDYVLGRSAMDLVHLTGIYADHPREEGEHELAYAARLVRPALRRLSPEIGAVVEEQDLSAAEELAFFPVLTEVMKRLGALKFRPVEG